MPKHLDLELLKSRIAVDETTECWNWTGPINRDGYGQVTYRYPNGRRRTYRTHRLIFEASRGRSVYPGLCVCHRCDNPRCNNPDHLFEGTLQDNYEDMCAKGRKAPDLQQLGALAAASKPQPCRAGERAGRAKLSLAQVREIRRLRWEEGWAPLRIAEAFGTTRRNVYTITLGQSWKDDP